MQVGCPWGIEKFSWKVESGALYKVSWGAFCILTPGSLYSKQNHWQLIHPLGSCETGLEESFQLLVHSFDQTICLGVVSSDVAGQNPQKSV